MSDTDEARRLALDKALREACAEYNTPTSNTDNEPHHQREGVGQALVAVLDYLRPETEVGLLGPLLELQTALAEVDEGKNNDLLTPRKLEKSGRPRSGRPRDVVPNNRLVIAAAAVTLTMQLGHKKAEALRLVCRHLRADKVSTAALDNFRKKLNHKGAMGYDQYHGCLRGAREFVGDTPEATAEAAHRLLTMLDPPE